MPKKKILQEHPKFYNSRNWNINNYNWSNYSTISMTKPNGAYTIKELIRRFNQGIIDPVTISTTDLEAVDFESPDMMEVNRMDLNEKHDFVETHYFNTKRMEKEFREGQAKKQADMENRIQEQLHKRMTIENEQKNLTE